jgi:hypothetical protein
VSFWTNVGLYTDGQHIRKESRLMPLSKLHQEVHMMTLLSKIIEKNCLCETNLVTLIFRYDGFWIYLAACTS